SLRQWMQTPFNQAAYRSWIQRHSRHSERAEQKDEAADHSGALEPTAQREPEPGQPQEPAERQSVEQALDHDRAQRGAYRHTVFVCEQHGASKLADSDWHQVVHREANHLRLEQL